MHFHRVHTCDADRCIMQAWRISRSIRKGARLSKLERDRIKSNVRKMRSGNATVTVITPRLHIMFRRAVSVPPCYVWGWWIYISITINILYLRSFSPPPPSPVTLDMQYANNFQYTVHFFCYRLSHPWTSNRYSGPSLPIEVRLPRPIPFINESFCIEHRFYYFSVISWHQMSFEPLYFF